MVAVGRAVASSVALWVTLATAVEAQADPAQAPPAPAASPQVTLTGRMQMQWNTTSVTVEDGAIAPIGANTFEMRRVRLGARVRVNDAVDGFVESDFAMGRLALKQAWMRVAPGGGISLRAGQFKKAFGMVELQSSAQLPMIERGVRIRGLDALLARGSEGEFQELRGDVVFGELATLLDVLGYSGYDMGVEATARLGGLDWAAGVFNGNGADARDENGGKSIAVRAAFTAETMPVTLGAGWSRRELNWPASASTETRTGNAFEVDAEYGGFRTGWWLLADAVTGSNLVTEERFMALQGVVSRYHGLSLAPVEGVEAVARASWGDPDRTVSGDAGLLLTPGVNLYFAGRNRLMFNWDVYVPEGDRFETQHAARAQANLYF